MVNAVLESARDGIDETMGAAAAEAQPNTPYVTGNLRRSIRPHEPAQIKGNRVEGEWGSHDVDYALPVEVGTATREGRHMLTNAADKEYPQLPDRIARRYRSSQS